MRILASFEWSFIWDNRDQLWEGFKDTIKTAAIGVAGSFLIGLGLGADRAHRIPVLNQLAWVYVEAIRNTPILVQIFLLYYGTPELGIHFETFTVAWLAITIWGGAFNTENFRAGFEAVPIRLREAGLALGFSRLKTFLNITLPIGGRIALPSSINTYISVVKNTALLTVVGFAEMTNTAYNLESESFKPTEIYLTLGVIYLVVVWSLSALVRLIESRLALPERG